MVWLMNQLHHYFFTSQLYKTETWHIAKGANLSDRPPSELKLG